MDSRTTFTYTAKRSLVLGHEGDERYTIEFDLQDATPSSETDADQERSLGGGSETIFYRIDKYWTLTFAPVSGAEFLLLREFLDSTESGSAFYVWLYGDESEPLPLKRIESGHVEEVFIRVGSSRRDKFVATIRAVEATGDNAGETQNPYQPGAPIDGQLGPGHIITEGGDYILTESGDRILPE